MVSYKLHVAIDGVPCTVKVKFLTKQHPKTVQRMLALSINIAVQNKNKHEKVFSSN